jgi:hypothetical protein
MTRLAAIQALLYRLAEAALLAWRQDRVFRGAVIGMGVTLAVLLGRPGASNQDHVLPPLDTSTARMPALPNPVGGVGVRPAQAPSDPVPKIAPGRSLEDLKISPVPNADRFGTVTSGKHP